MVKIDLQNLERLLEPACRAHGMELVDLHFAGGPKGRVLRLVIDRLAAPPNASDAPPQGVSLDDCAAVSRDVSTLLDSHENALPMEHYHLEVSSPGIERPLVKLRDFQRFVGSEVRIRTRSPIGKRRGFRGRLLGVEASVVRLEQDGNPIEIPHEAIAKANLVYDLRA